MKNISILILYIFISSCNSRFKDPSDDFKQELEVATPDFRQGWKDGCESAMGAASNSFNQMFHKNNQVDGYKMSYSGQYQTAWNNAWWYCYRKDWTNQRSTPWSSVFGGLK